MLGKISQSLVFPLLYFLDGSVGAILYALLNADSGLFEPDPDVFGKSPIGFLMRILKRG